MTDPRFDGEVTVAMNWDDIHPDTPESMDIRKSVYRVENEEGA